MQDYMLTVLSCSVTSSSTTKVSKLGSMLGFKAKCGTRYWNRQSGADTSRGTASRRRSLMQNYMLASLPPQPYQSLATC